MKNNYAIEMRGITKKFGNLIANDSIDLLVKENTIHGLLGENGAGKSTLMSVLFGLYNPDGGKIFVNGEESRIKSPLDASGIGIGMVHQHFKLVEIFNAADNILLGSEPTKMGFLNKAEEIAKIQQLADKYSFDIDFTKEVSRLSVGQKQKIEILKTLHRNAKILIFDEPTAVLAPKEIDGFLKLLLDFKKEGKTIIIITHKLDEIKAVCDEATIIRKGKFIKTIDVKKTTEKEMSTLMVGKSVEEIRNNKKIEAKETILEIEGLNVHIGDIHKLKDFSATIKRGEIVAIAGVEGNGQTELIEAISGLNGKYEGTIKYKGLPYNNKMVKKYGSELTEFDLREISIKARISLGMSIIPEDRHKYGLILDDKLFQSMHLQEYNSKKFSLHGLIRKKEIKKYAKQIIDEYDVRGAHSGEAVARSLSGGNQQKAIVGREISREHNFLLVAQPTRGLDVGAINNIHQAILRERELNRAVLLVSYELSEILALADKVIVLNKGAITGVLERKDISRNKIGDLMLGANPSSEKNKKTPTKTKETEVKEKVDKPVKNEEVKKEASKQATKKKVVVKETVKKATTKKTVTKKPTKAIKKGDK